MLKRIITLFIIFMTFITASKEVLWTDKPIEFNLPVNQEIYVRFPYAVATTNILNPAVSSQLSQILTPQGVLYMTAKAEFEKTRMIVELINGELIMTDISAQSNNTAQSITVVDPKTLPPVVKEEKKPKKASDSGKEKTKVKEPVVKKPPNPMDNPNMPDFLKKGLPKTLNASRAAQIGYAEMVRFAFRQHYGPSRLAGNSLGATKKSVTSKYLNSFLRMNQGRLKITPISQYLIQGKYVTVLKASNLTSNTLQFDPRAFRGQLSFVASMSPNLAPNGQVNSETLWAVITQKPFNEAIKVR